MFLYRDEYYRPDTERKGITEILIRKHRNGPVGSVDVYFNPAQMRFADLEKRQFSPGEVPVAEMNAG